MAVQISFLHFVTQFQLPTLSQLPRNLSEKRRKLTLI